MIILNVTMFIQFFLGPDEETWRESIHKQMEEELSQRVRDALETPPLERMERQKNVHGNDSDLKELNSHILFDLTDKDEYLRSRRWRALQAKRQMRKIMSMDYISPPSPSRIEFMFKDELSRSNQDEFPGVFGLNTFSDNIRDNENHFHVERLPLVRNFQQQFYTKNGFVAALHDGKFPDGTPISKDGNGCYTDQYGVVRNEDGPFWPAECTPLFATPHFQWWLETPREPLQFFVKSKYLVHNVHVRLLKSNPTFFESYIPLTFHYTIWFHCIMPLTRQDMIDFMSFLYIRQQMIEQNAKYFND